MNFEDIKKKAREMKDKTLAYSSEKLAGSSFTIHKKEELDACINKSGNTEFTNKETGIKKTFTKQSIVIFGDEKSDFFKKELYKFPVMAAKAFSQNISIKLATNNIEGVKLEEYKVISLPSLVLFENKEVKKVITDEENILKLVKSFDLDINKAIENM